LQLAAIFFSLYSRFRRDALLQDFPADDCPEETVRQPAIGIGKNDKSFAAS